MMVAVIGSAEAGRTYEPEMPDPAAAIQAAEEIGRELATRGHQLVVFSSDSAFIEGAAVRGYVGSGQARPGSVLVRNTVRQSLDVFPEHADHEDLFDHAPAQGGWEVAYYRALFEVDGVILIGGGRSTMIAAIIALARRTAIGPLTAFGGAAARAWERLDHSPNTATREDLSAFTGRWSPDKAAEAVLAVERQHQARLVDLAKDGRRRRTETWIKVAGLLSALLFLLLGLLTVVLAATWKPEGGGAIALLVFGPVLAAMSGGLIRRPTEPSESRLQAAVFGAAAGGMSALLFIGAQLLTDPELLQGESAARLCIYVVPVGFIAGLAFDAVLTKLRGTDVVQTSSVQSPKV
ncbi:hypothetical protein [Kineosporia babensis]|uniref:Uncharacterized protein n=1 Tax=Kineosporia babensis TaxID=499548 RepID=A0A9X1NAV6_9ACTN|nr:hypothetical protein [Kineosporia babensis]MCD5310733.1 hypothetical protein [Kineosporia babensis]